MSRSILARSGPLGLIFSTASILLAVLGQFFLSSHDDVPAILLYAIAAALLGLALRFSVGKVQAAVLRGASLQALEKRRSPISRRGKTMLLAASLFLGLLTFLASGGNRFTVLNVSLWLSSILLLLFALAERPHWPRVTKGVLACIALLLLLGSFFYYFRLDSVPAEMTSDHAEKLTDIYDVLNGQTPIFFVRNTGREPLEFYLVAAFIRLVHHSLDFMALKWVTATVGLLVIPLTFLLGRTLFDNWVGLIGGVLVAINMWGVGIARMGLRFPFTPFFAALTFLFLFRALKFGRRNDFLLTGFFLGAGLYGYHAFKIAPLVVAACFLLWPLLEGRVGRALRGQADWQPLKHYASNVLAGALVTLLVFAPLLRYMTDHPESFWQRVLTRVSTEERPLPGNPVEILGDNVKNLSLMFNVEGDHSWPNTLSDVPVLDDVSGGLFVLGVVYALYLLMRKRESAPVYVLVSLAGLLLPSALAIAFPIENPSVVRAGGAIPFVFLVAALPVARVARSISFGQGALRAALPAAVLLPLFFISAALNYDRYFVQYDAQYRANSWNTSEVAATMLNFESNGGSLYEAWVVAYPYWIDTRNVAINLGNIRWNNVIWRTSEITDARANKGPRLYILSPADRANLDGLSALFPQGEARVYPSRTVGKQYIGFYVPGRTQSRQR